MAAAVYAVDTLTIVSKVYESTSITDGTLLPDLYSEDVYFINYNTNDIVTIDSKLRSTVRKIEIKEKGYQLGAAFTDDSSIRILATKQDDSTQRLYRYNPITYQLEDQVELTFTGSTCAVKNKNIWIGGGSELHVINSKSGKSLFTFNLDQPAGIKSTSCITQGDRVFFASTTSVKVYNGQTREELATLLFPEIQTAYVNMALDSQKNLLYVALYSEGQPNGQLARYNLKDNSRMIIDLTNNERPTGVFVDTRTGQPHFLTNTKILIPNAKFTTFTAVNVGADATPMFGVGVYEDYIRTALVIQQGAGILALKSNQVNITYGNIAGYVILSVLLVSSLLCSTILVLVACCEKVEQRYQALPIDMDEDESFRL
jgi:hypothetical protein